MDIDFVDVMSRHPAPPRRRLTTAEFYKMAEVGILGENDRVELIEGQLVAMAAIGVRHALAVDALNDQFMAAVAGRAKVRVQNPVSLTDGTEPQPDLALVRLEWPGRALRHPGPQDILLLVEVSDSSLLFDSRAKREIYARSKVVEYWIVDLTRNVVRIHRDPTPDGYATESETEAPGRLEVEAVPGLTILAGPLFA